jgi:hypothetical protein
MAEAVVTAADEVSSRLGWRGDARTRNPGEEGENR